MTVEVDLDEETARALSREAAEFEFRGSESYVRWLLDHRALVVAKSDAMAERLSTLEARLMALEGAGDDAPAAATAGDGADAGGGGASVSDDGVAGEAVREVIDEWLVVARQADDDDIEQAVTTMEREGDRVGPAGDPEHDAKGGDASEEFVDGTLDDEDLRL